MIVPENQMCSMLPYPMGLGWSWVVIGTSLEQGLLTFSTRFQYLNWQKEMVL
jgi:hypothetical protein